MRAFITFHRGELRNLQNDAESDERVTFVWFAASTTRRSAFLRATVEVSPTCDAVAALTWPLRVIVLAFSIIPWIVPITAPLCQITVHVVQTETIGAEAAYGRFPELLAVIIVGLTWIENLGGARDLEEIAHGVASGGEPAARSAPARVDYAAMDPHGFLEERMRILDDRFGPREAMPFDQGAPEEVVFHVQETLFDPEEEMVLSPEPQMPRTMGPCFGPEPPPGP